MTFYEDDLDLDGAGAIGAIVLHALPPRNSWVSQTAMRLRLFPLSLSGEIEFKEAFLERFYPKSIETQMKDDTSAHKQLPGETMHDTWWRFSQKLKKCPNNDLTESHSKQEFYRSLNYVTKPFVEAVCGGSFMRKPFQEIMLLMDEVAKTNRA
ncbi:hypothetical protein KY289_030438 [Solanum tuberosum]|nr:hypothetical protein KY289_030438 [Solanum tuberosum]